MSRCGNFRNAPKITPDEYPALCAPRYGDWEETLYQGQEVALFHQVIEFDDVPALRDMIRIVGPDLLYWDDKDYQYSPTLVYAAELGRNSILTALLDYRDALSPAEWERPQRLFDEEEAANNNPLERVWSTPLITACMCAQADTVQLLLKRMPEVDVNARDRFGYTALLGVAAFGQRTTLSANSHGYLDGWMAEEAAKRVAIVRLLLAHGANPRHSKTKLMWNGHGILRTLDQPGSLGSALVHALVPSEVGAGTDAALVRVLVDEAGIDVHRGFFASTACLDGTGPTGTVDHDPVQGETTDTRGPLTYLTPLAIAALHRNASGVAALLQTPGADLTTDLMAPVVPALSTFDDIVEEAPPSSWDAFFNGMTAMRALHAAMVGPPVAEEGWAHWLGQTQLFFQRGFQRHVDLFVTEEKAREAAGTATYTNERGWSVLPFPANQARDALYCIADERAATVREAVLDDGVTTVELLTADPAVCAATINATHPYKGGHYTPLHLGARFDRLPMLRVLLERGADPSLPVPRTGGRSVFFMVFASLLQLCAPTVHMFWIEQGDGGNSVRDLDAQMGTETMTEIVRHLLRRGPMMTTDGEDNSLDTALLHEADVDGNTALHWAAGYGLRNAMAALLALGGRMDARNKAGEVPTEGKPPTTSRKLLSPEERFY